MLGLTHMKGRKTTKIAISIIILLAVGLGVFYAYKKNIFTKKEIKVATIGEIAGQKTGDRIQDLGNRNQEIEINNENAEDNNKEPVASNQLAVVEKQKTDTTQQKSSGNIIQKFVSFGYQKSSGRTIKAIIIHTSYNNLGGDSFDFSKVMQEWKDAGVSPHYAIDRSGTIYQLVADQNIAWHAGTSKLPDGTTDVNGASIGIEIVNDQSSKFTEAQYASLNRLIGDLRKKFPVKYVLGHDDIAPGRKTDPWGIEWGKIQK